MMNQMSEVQTLQVGTLELRKTAEGWEYLSEGLQGEPDRWCNAATSLGPFSNLGVSILLDELVGARELAALRVKSVWNCRHWTSKGLLRLSSTLSRANA